MFCANVIYLELFVALFFLPGFFITVILGLKKFRFLLSFALSYSLLVLTLLPFEYYAQPIARWQWCVLLEWVLLAVWAVVKIFTHGNNNQSRQQSAVATKPVAAPLLPSVALQYALRLTTGRRMGSSMRSGLIRRRLTSRLIVPLVLAGVICGYLAYAGIYLEIPSDAWEHIRRFQWQKLAAIDNGCFQPGISVKNFFITEGPYRYVIHWYFIHAWLSEVSGLAIMDSLNVLTFVNVLTFLLAIYYFGLYLFAGLRVSAMKKMLMAAFASLFSAATMGFMVFAYIRYYAFAPTILNYGLFLAAMVVIIAWLRSSRLFGHALWIAPVLLLVTGLIHAQETLFIFFMTLALGIVETIRIFWPHVETNKVLPTPAAGHPSKGGELLAILSRPRLRRGEEGQGWVGHPWPIKEWKSVILTALLLLVFFAGFAAIRYLKSLPWISANMIMPNVGIPPEPVNFIFRDLMISPPSNPWLRLAAYQLFVFYQVVGCWGLFVYLLFILMCCRFIKMPYLVAGMVLVPLLTAFNPLMIDMMSRVGQDMALYRFNYIIPLPFIVGYLFIYFSGNVREYFQKKRTLSVAFASPIWGGLKIVGCLLVLAGLIGLVFPLNAAGIYAPYSKIYTLRKITDYQSWDDMGGFIEKFTNKLVLTDAFTSRIMVRCCPKVNTTSPKWLNSKTPETEQPEPSWKYLHDRGVIIINCRPGPLSVTGKIAKHWPENILDFSRYYSAEVKSYLESNPGKFRKIWTQNQVVIYEVR